MTVSVKPPTRSKRSLPNSPLNNSERVRVSNRFVGTQAELRVARYLCALTYTLIASHVQCGHQEIDIVALDTSCNELVFFEVKYRSTSKAGGAEGALNGRKMKNLKIAAHWYLQKHPWSGNFRLDGIAITAGKLHHYKNITWW